MCPDHHTPRRRFDRSLPLRGSQVPHAQDSRASWMHPHGPLRALPDLQLPDRRGSHTEPPHPPLHWRIYGCVLEPRMPRQEHGLTRLRLDGSRQVSVLGDPHLEGHHQTRLPGRNDEFLDPQLVIGSPPTADDATRLWHLLFSDPISWTHPAESGWLPCHLAVRDQMFTSLTFLVLDTTMTT